MQIHHRPTTVIGLVLLVALVGACSTSATTTATPSPSAVARTPVPDTPATRDAFATAICPIFLAILEVDPRLAAMRAAGAAGGDMTVHQAELETLAEELLVILGDLEAVPDWGPGQRAQIELITALHRIRTEIVVVVEDLTASGAAETIAAIPFIASDAMDRAMASAASGGLTCTDDS
jgi:hypothetical protein